MYFILFFPPFSFNFSHYFFFPSRVYSVIFHSHKPIDLTVCRSRRLDESRMRSRRQSQDSNYPEMRRVIKPSSNWWGKRKPTAKTDASRHRFFFFHILDNGNRLHHQKVNCVQCGAIASIAVDDISHTVRSTFVDSVIYGHHPGCDFYTSSQIFVRRPFSEPRSKTYPKKVG